MCMVLHICAFETIIFVWIKLQICYSRTYFQKKRIPPKNLIVVNTRIFSSSNEFPTWYTAFSISCRRLTVNFQREYFKITIFKCISCIELQHLYPNGRTSTFLTTENFAMTHIFELKNSVKSLMKFLDRSVEKWSFLQNRPFWWYDSQTQ